MANKIFKNFLLFVFLSTCLQLASCRRSGHKIILTGEGGGGGGSSSHHSDHHSDHHQNHQAVVPIPYPVPIPVIQHHPVFIEKQVPIYLPAADHWASSQNHYETLSAPYEEHAEEMHSSYNYPAYNHWFGTYHDK